MRFYIGAVLFAAVQLCQAVIPTEIEPKKIQLGESFTLTMIFGDPNQVHTPPNLTALQQDFIIEGSARSFSYTNINGQSHSIGKWTITLSPKKTGMLTIPAVPVGNDQTVAAQIEVTAEKNEQEQSAISYSTQDVILKTKVEPQTAWVNQEIVYTVKLYTKQNLVDAAYQPPRVENALIINLGGGKRSRIFENGEEYIVEEQKYAIFPQKSGNLQIIPPLFRAVVYDFEPKKISVKGSQHDIDIRSIPEGFTSKSWLVAKNATLTEEYENAGEHFLQGDTLVRNITLDASEVPGELLPQFEVNGSTDFKVYPEKPQVITDTSHDEVRGFEKLRVTYLFNKAGSITLPEIRVRWLNAASGKEEVAVLPAKVLQIDAKESPTMQSNSAPTTHPEVATSPGSASANSSSSRSYHSLAWMLALLFGLAWIITLIHLWRSKHTKVKNSKRKVPAELKQACRNNDKLAAQAALIEWGKIQWPQAKILNLNEVGKKVSEAGFKKEIAKLSEAIYSPAKSNPWQGEQLWQYVIRYRKRKIKKGGKKELPPINPQG
jgi:hypothetical protein